MSRTPPNTHTHTLIPGERENTMTNEQLTAKLSTLEALTLTAVSHPLADEELRLASLSCLTYFKGFVAATLRLDSSHYNAIAGNDLEAPIEHLSGWLQEAAKLNALTTIPKA